MSRPSARTAVSWLLSVLAFLLVWFALVGPNRIDNLTVGAFVSIPIEGVLVVAIAACLPARWRSVLAAVVGVVLGLLTLVKILDMGFYDALDRPFNPVTDWTYLGPAMGVLRDSVGSTRAIAAEGGAVLLVLAILIFLPLATSRMTRLAAGHRRPCLQAAAVLGVAYALCAGLGVQAVGQPVASWRATALAYDQVREVRTVMKDQRSFNAAITATDRFAITPGNELLSGLRGKDVIVAFVESYGQVAIRGSAFSPQVDAVLNTDNQQLDAAGFSARSAMLTSPTFGGISWLAHSTLQSGLWIDNQQRYNQLVASGRFTLSDAFKRAGWRTVVDVPANTDSWPQGKSFYHYDKLYDEHNVGYAGPKFSYASMPDQYTLAAFQRLELAKPDHPPVMAEIDLVSSHTPWAPLPELVDWNAIGDGSVFNGMPAQGQSPSALWRNSSHVRAAYGQSIQYSLNSLVSFVQNVHDNNLVLLLLGDHQPATIVSGSAATHNVPITIIAHDPKVLDQISAWGWQAGMLPGPTAPVWPMDAFRDRFLSAYGSHLPAKAPDSEPTPH